MTIRSMSLGAGIGAGALNLLAWIALTVDPPHSAGGGTLLGLHIFAAFVGGIFGGGVGLAVGAGLGGPRSVPRPSLVRDGAGNVLGRLSDSPGKGLSVLDLVTSTLYSLTLTGVGATALLFALGGPRRLAKFVMEVSPLGSVGPGWALMSTLGSIAVVTLVPILALASSRPPLRRVEGGNRKLVAGAGFLSGILWPGLILVSGTLL